jgi:hypothetical protein
MMTFKNDHHIYLKYLFSWKHQKGENTGIPIQMPQYKQGAGGQSHYKTYDSKKCNSANGLQNRSGIPFKLHWLVMLDNDGDDDPFPIFPLSTERWSGDSSDGPTNCSNTRSRNKVRRTDVDPFRGQ